MTREHRTLAHAFLIAAAIAAAAWIAEAAPAGAAAAAGGEAGVRLDLNLGAIVVGLGGLVAGLAAFLKLRQDRPKIVAEIAKLDEEREAEREQRLQRALNAAWAEVDRLEAIRNRQRGELERCHERIDELEDRETTLEREVGQLRDRLTALDS